MKVCEVCDMERAKKGKIYKAGSTLIQLSATRGQTVYHDCDGEVKDMYCVCTPKAECVPYYVFIAIQRAMPEFCHRYQTGLNIQFNVLKEYLNIQWHPLDVQGQIANACRSYDDNIREEREEIERLNNIKKYLLKNMFP